MMRKKNPSRNSGDEIGYRLREPDTIKRPKVAQQVNRRDQEDNLPAQAEKHRFPGDADALEELADDDLRPDTEKGQHRQDKPPVRNAADGKSKLMIQPSVVIAEAIPIASLSVSSTRSYRRAP